MGPVLFHYHSPTFRCGDELWCSRLEAKAISYHIPENWGDSKLEGDCLGGGPAAGIRASPSPGQWSGGFPGPACLELAGALEGVCSQGPPGSLQPARPFTVAGALTQPPGSS